MSYLRCYVIQTGREMKPMRAVRIGGWFHYVPLNSKPRIILKAFGRSYGLVYIGAKNRRPFQRNATGFSIGLGRLGEFFTVANRD